MEVRTARTIEASIHTMKPWVSRLTLCQLMLPRNIKIRLIADITQRVWGVVVNSQEMHKAWHNLEKGNVRSRV